jgi:hypothetical protein
VNGPGDPNQGGYPPQGAGYPPPHGQPHGQPGQGGYPPHQPYPPGYPPQKNSNTALLITLIVLLVAAIAGGAILYFTGALGGSESKAATNTVAVAPAPGPAPGPVVPAPTPAPAPPGPNGASLTQDQVAERLQAGVQQFQSRLPLRNGPATITAVSSTGTVVTMVMEISQALTPSDWAQLQPEFERSLCAGPFSQAISAGASAQVQVTDTSGDSRTYTIASC